MSFSRTHYKVSVDYERLLSAFTIETTKGEVWGDSEDEDEDEDEGEGDDNDGNATGAVGSGKGEDVNEGGGCNGEEPSCCVEGDDNEAGKDGGEDEGEGPTDVDGEGTPGGDQGTPMVDKFRRRLKRCHKYMDHFEMHTPRCFLKKKPGKEPGKRRTKVGPPSKASNDIPGGSRKRKGFLSDGDTEGSHRTKRIFNNPAGRVHTHLG